VVLPPGSIVGILGGGQLGRMMALAAARLGYKCHILDPHEHPCAAEVSARFTRAAYDDVDALRRLAEQCDVVTYEFENIPVEPLAVLGDKLAPSTRSLAVAQDRAAEKRFLETCGARVAPWREVDGATDIVAALEALGSPILLKSRRTARARPGFIVPMRPKPHGKLSDSSRPLPKRKCRSTRNSA
jgi:5-(carboxyamino)imidazole ribonucleotide synthase